ncbi:MAG: hypothetical protein PVG78_08375 [Desulfobacterales bacterium]|jgi:hypothetical protein
MSQGKTVYLICPRYKGQPRKHLTVCEVCRYKKKCPAYLRYRQPELPFAFSRKTAAG